MRVDQALLGYVEFYVEQAEVAAFLNVCAARACPYEWRASEEGRSRFRCRWHCYRVLGPACERAGVTLHAPKRGGLPFFLYRYRKRAGLLAGAVLAAVMVCLSSCVIWDVRVEGEEGVNALEVKRLLSECGLSVGTLIPRLDTDEVESRLITTSTDVAWVSVNRKGTVAYVQVRPLLRPEAVDSAGETVNLVASADGVIESVRLMAGDAVVRPGDVVRAGQLLISGVRDIREDGYSLTEARGEVLARVTRTLTVEIPLSYEQKIYTEGQRAEKTLFFFGKAIKITKSTGIIGGSCDTIKKMESFSLFGRHTLPISLQTVDVRPYEMSVRTLTQEEAEAQAYEQLWQRLTLATGHATLLSRRVECEMTDEVCRLVCTYTCVENIATPLPFSAEESERVS